MKQLTIILLGLIGIAYGQSSPTSAKVRYVNGLYVGTKLDSYFNAADSNAIYWRADSVIMAKYKGTARALAFAVSGGYLPISDTAAMLAPYLRRTDSTGLLNQVVRTFGTQTVGGNKTFSNDIVVNNLTIGKGAGNVLTNTVFGSAALTSNTIGENITAIGRAAGSTNTTGSNNTYIGALSAAGSVSNNNETIIGASAIGNGSNTVTIGNSSVTGNYFNGFLKQTSVTSALIKASATGQFEAAVAGTDYVAPSALSGYLPLSGGALTGALSGTSLSMSGNGSFTSGVTLRNSGNSDYGDIFVSPSVFDMFIDYPTSRNLRFRNTSGTEAMRLTSDAKLLINTTTNNGTDALQVAGSGLFTGVTSATNGSLNITSTDPAIRFRVTGGTANARIYEWRAIASGGAFDYFQLRKWNDAENSTTELMKIDNSGAITASSSVTALSLIKSGGTSTQALIADGSVQTLTSGTYTPTLTNTQNIASSTASVSSYTRIGNIVTVYAIASATTSAAGQAELTFSLPIATTAANAVVVGSGIDSIRFPINNGSSGTTVGVRWTATSGTATNINVIFQYTVN